MLDQSASLHWDIFCRVIDNYGDAGVSWRLAKDLASRGEHVRLFIDQPEILTSLAGNTTDWPQIDVQHWPDVLRRFSPDDVADVVIETFACNPPIVYIDAMRDARTPIAWINLEYLSAEEWVHSHHGIASPHPRYALTKHFYFPGFTPETGGLLREPGLAEAIDHNQQNIDHQTSGQRIFLFTYEQPHIESWLDTLESTGPAILGVAPCPALKQIKQWVSSHKPPQHLSIERLSFVPQHDFDALIGNYDWLFIRGEDSFVRAQWAAKPLIWHIYPQTDDVHLSKLQAFYDRYLDQGILTPEQRSAYWHFVLAWNNGVSDRSHDTIVGLWHALSTCYPALMQNARAWRSRLLEQADLVSQLRDFVRHLVK